MLKNFHKESSFVKKLKYRVIILPTEEWKVAWDFFVGILILYSVTVVPFRIGFHITPDLKGVIFDYIVDIMFGIDMILTFLTAYEQEGKLVRHHDLIAINYLKTWFVIDFVSTFPFDQIIPAIVKGAASGTLRSIKLIRALRLFRLLKLMRVARLKRKIKEAKVSELIHPIVYELAGLFTKIFLIAHLLACVYYFLSGCHHHDHSDDVWDECGHLGSLASMYLVAMYWTMATLLSVGYGDVVLSSNNGRLFSILVMFIGSITFGFIVATVSESVKNWDPRATAKKIKMEEVREYITEKGLPKVLQTKIWKHFEYYYNKLSTFPEDIILDSMPIMLQQLVLEKTRGDLSHFKLFHKEDYGILSQILPLLKPACVEPTESLVKEGDYLTDMFFVVQGCLHATMNNSKTNRKLVLVGIFGQGSDFGSCHALSCRTISWATYRATVLSDVMWLAWYDLQTIVHHNEALGKLFRTRGLNELSTQKEVCSLIHKTEEVNGMRVPAFILIDGLVISCRHAIRMLGEDAQREKAAKVYKVVYLQGKDHDGKDLYLEDQETTQQMWSRRVINPNAFYKVLFDVLIGLLALTSSIVIPYRLAFAIPVNVAWDVFDLLTELLFGVDLLMSFFTAYEQSDYVLNTVHKNIARRYLKSWFIVDFLSTVPFYRLAGSGSGSTLQILKTLRIGRVMRIFRIFRLARVIKLVRYVTSHTSILSSEYAAIEDGVTRICKLLGFMGFVTHLVGCFWAWISLSSHGGHTWYANIGLSNTDYGKKYVAAIYWAYYTMATVGFGDIPPVNDHERLFAVFTMILGSTILAYIVGIVSSYAFNKEGLRGLQEQKLNMVRDYLAEQGTPKTLKEAVMKHFCYTIELKTVSNETLLWNKLPHHRRLECINYILRPSLERLAMFSKIKESIMAVLYMNMEPCFAVAETYVYNFETGSGGIYFILRGSAMVIDEDDQEREVIIATIHPGMFFGHEKLLGLSTDFIGIRSHTSLSMLYLSDMSIATMQDSLPLAYNALVTLLQEACQARGQELSERDVLPRDNEESRKFTNDASVSRRAGGALEMKQKKVLGRALSNPIEDLLGWIGTDMDEGTWRQTSNLTHFRKKSEVGVVKPSSTLSTNSKDRYRAMKANLGQSSSKLESEDSATDSSKGGGGGGGSLKGRLLRSGRDSYANLYGTHHTSPGALVVRRVEDESKGADEGGGGVDDNADSVMEADEDIGPSPKSRIKPGGGGGDTRSEESGSKRINTHEISKHLFQLTSFDIKSSRVIPVDKKMVDPTDEVADP
jgi:CRP-like cAMP-binding protein